MISIDVHFHLDMVAPRRLGVPEEGLQGTDAVLLPENIATAKNRQALYDAQGAADLAAALRAVNLSCATSSDILPEARTLVRKDVGLWLGILWVLNAAALPMAANVLGNLITSWIQRHPSEDGRGDVRFHLRAASRGRVTEIDYSGDAETLVRLLGSLSPGTKPGTHGADAARSAEATERGAAEPVASTPTTENRGQASGGERV